MQFNALLRQMCSMLILTAAIWLWQVYARVLVDAAVLVSTAVVVLIIAVGLWQRARVRRRVWLDAYFLHQSPINKWLKGGVWMAALQAISAVVLGVYLALALIRIPSVRVWMSLLIVALVFPLLSHLIARGLRWHTKPSYRRVLSMRWAAFALGAILWLFLIFVSYQSSYPDFRNANLDQSIWYMMSQEQARSAWLLNCLEFVAASDGLRFWLAQHLLPAPATSLWQVLAWCIVLAQEALFVWSYLMLCTGVLSVQRTDLKESLE